MNAYVVFWAVVIIFSLISFLWMSAKVLYKGFPELLEMFDIIKKQLAERINEGDE